MSRLWLNIRFYIFHLEAGDPKWYSFKVTVNNFHLKNWRIFAVYRLSWPTSAE